MKFHTIIPLILTLSLLGCQPSPPLPVGEGLGVRETPTASHIPVPTAAPTLMPTPTEVPLEALPVEVLVQKYLAGEIDDVSGLNLEQHAAFSAAWVEIIRANSKEVVFGDKEAYLTNDLEMNEYDDGSKPEERKFVTMYSVRQDTNGVWHYTDYKGEEHPIANFDGVQKDAITDEKSTAMGWPATETLTLSGYENLTMAQALLKESKEGNPNDLSIGKGAYTEAILLRRIISKVFFDVGSDKPRSRSVMEIGVPIYSNDGVLLGLQRMLITPWNNYLLLYAEGQNWEMPIDSTAWPEHEFKKVEGNQAIWLMTYGVTDPFLAQQNKDDWPALKIHNQEVLRLLREGKPLNEALGLSEAAIIILQQE